jgi:hypothetical protein
VNSLSDDSEPELNDIPKWALMVAGSMILRIDGRLDERNFLLSSLLISTVYEHETTAACEEGGARLF